MQGQRGDPVLAIANSTEHPSAGTSGLFIAVPVFPQHRFQPWAVRMVFAQALLAMLEARRAGRL